MQTITITGHLGSGKSTIAKMLAKQLNIPHYSTGDAQREIARQMGLTTLELNHLADQDPSIDEKIDGVFKTLDKAGKPYVIDSRLAWHFMPHSFKVKLEVSPQTAAERIFADKSRTGERLYTSVDEALKTLLQRRQSETTRFQKTYNIDIEKNDHFDLVLDTTTLSPQEICSAILTAYRQVNPLS